MQHVPDPSQSSDRAADPRRPEVAGTEYVARVLATVGGYVDAVGYLALFRLFTAHQSGNSVGFGVAIGSGDWTTAWRRGTAIGAYVVGVLIGTLMVEVGQRWRIRSTGMAVAAAEVAALCAALGVGESAARAGVLAPADTGAYAAAAACLAGAMGLQTVVLRRVGRRTIRTTFVTGVLANLAETFVGAWFRPGREHRRRLLSLSALLGSVWVLYLGGAVAGAVAERAWSFAALAVPTAVVIAVALWQQRAGFQPDLPDLGLGE